MHIEFCGVLSQKKQYILNKKQMKKTKTQTSVTTEKLLVQYCRYQLLITF